MFCLGAFVLGTVGQEFTRGTLARKAMAGESAPRALAALVARNRRRYGGYIVHVGIVVLFVGVAASSSFRHNTQRALAPGQSTTVGSYRITYVEPTATITPKYDRAHTGSTLSLGAELDVTKGGRHVATLQPSEGYYASQEASQGTVGSLIGGQPVSHVALDSGVTRDVWSAIEPDIETPALKQIVEAGNKTLGPEEAPIALLYLARSYLAKPPPTQFNLLVSPLVMWIWLGGLIVFVGGLIAIWPVPLRARAPVSVRARLARGLARS